MPPPSSTRSAGAAGRYTVVYEGDPVGAMILDGQPAPGEAITVGLGDAFAMMAEVDNARMVAVAKIRDAEARVVAITAEKTDLLKALRQLNAFAKKAATLDYNEDITVMGIAHYTAHVDALIARAEGRPASSGDA